MHVPIPITVITTRTVKPGCEETFERALHDFIQRSFELPGQLGVHVIRPAPETASRDYGIVRKFCDEAALKTFLDSPAYGEWSQVATDLTDGTIRTERLSGLESWFTATSEVLRPLPKWKMAAVTLMGVYPTSLVIAKTVRLYTRDWPFLLDAFVFAVCMVAMLNWIVMPQLTRFLHGWLHAGATKKLLLPICVAPLLMSNLWR